MGWGMKEIFFFISQRSGLPFVVDRRDKRSKYISVKRGNVKEEIKEMNGCVKKTYRILYVSKSTVQLKQFLLFVRLYVLYLFLS